MAGGSASVVLKPTGAGTAGPDGHREDLNYRGKGCALHTNSPVGGNFSGRSAPFSSNSQPVQYPPSDSISFGPWVELMQFDGANPKLWQRRSEEYFHRWHTPMHQWVSDSSSLFVGDAATWLEAYLHQNPRPPWQEFVAAVITRFGRNQHQTLVRRLFHIQQTTIVADYVYRFAQLVDQIAAYETRPDPVHYTTRFLDGLKPAVRVLVAIQQPPDLDTAYSLALLYEELGDGSTPLNTALPATPHNRRFQQPFPVAQPPPPPQPPGKWVSRSVEERRATEQQRGQGDDRWSSLKAYRRSKGLCFVVESVGQGIINARLRFSSMSCRK
jgi:hypothetical protein